MVAKMLMGANIDESELGQPRLGRRRRIYDYAVGGFLVKPLEGLVEDPAGGHVRLEPKAVGVLGCLAGSQGRTVTKHVLLDSVWSEVEVTEHVLTRSISQIRRAFGDDGRKQAVIRTVYKRGYRLLPPVSFAEAPEQTVEAVPPPVRDPAPRAAGESLGYRQILSATQDHIYVYDRDCRYLFANSAGARAVGLSSAQMEGKHWRELGLVAEILEPFEARVRQCFNQGKAFLQQISYPTVFGDRFYEYTLDPVRDSGGATVAVLAVVRDITSRCQVFPAREDRDPS